MSDHNDKPARHKHIIHGANIGKLNPIDDCESLVSFFDGVVRLAVGPRACGLTEIFLPFDKWQERRAN